MAFSREEAINKVKDIINDMSESDMIYLHNEYCEAVSYYDDRIYSYYELDDLCCGMSPTDIIENYGELAYCDYFKCGVYIEKADYSDVYVDDIAEYCVDEEESFDNYEINDIISNLTDDEDDE